MIDVSNVSNDANDAKGHGTATERNREPILGVLERFVGRGDVVLEIASGGGEHALFLAPALGATWQPSDNDPEARARIEALRKSTPNDDFVRPAMAIDATAATWPALDRAPNIVVCINMIHISPWRATEGLLEGAARVLANDGLLYLYGPFQRHGKHTAPSNEAFDQGLRARNPEWGVRNLEDIIKVSKRKFDLVEVVEMPANNLSVIFKHKG